MDGLLVVDSEQNIILINDDGSRLLCLDVGDETLAAIASRLDLLSMAGDSIPREKWPTELALHGTFVKDFVCKAKDRETGRIVVLEFNTMAVKTPAGAVGQFVVACWDITGRDRTDAVCALAAAIVEHSHDAIIGKDTGGTVTSWNAGATKIFGYTSEEMVGQSIKRLLPLDLLDEEAEILARLQRGETADHIESVRLRKDGQPIHVALTISPIRNVRGEIIGASKVARDITARKQFDRRCVQSQKLESIGQLAGGVAHDFNNLLAIVLGSLELQHRAIVDNPEALTRWEAAHRAALRGVDLTRRLLTFSSMKQFTFKPTNLHHSVRNTAQLALPLIGANVHIVLDLAADMPDVSTDQSSLEGVLLNIVVNARDAMPKGGTVTISTKICSIAEEYAEVLDQELAPGHYACIMVSDTGSGMSPSVLEHALDPFFTTKARGKGTGLGLSMASGFAKLSKGCLSIQSKVGLGTTVKLMLPISSQRAEGSQPRFHKASEKARSGNVMIVDDEDELVSIISFYLEALGYKTFVAGDAEDTLKIAASPVDIDVMLTDIVLTGDVDGIDLGHAVQRLRPGISVLYTSGVTAGAFPDSKVLPPGLQIIQKPYMLDELAAAIDTAMLALRSREKQPVSSAAAAQATVTRLQAS